MELTKSKVATQQPSDSRSLGSHDDLVDLHWEISVDYEVPDTQTRTNRLRWFVWSLVRIGNPPSKTKTATASEVTTVTASSVPSQMHWPNRRLSRVEPHRS